MKNKIGIALGLLVTILVCATLAVYVIYAGAIGYAEMAPVAIVVILVAFSAYVLWDRARSVSKGEPAVDERLKNANYRAGYYGFIAAIWSAVLAPTLVDILFGYELEGSRVTAAVVIVSGLVFAVSYLYMTRRGN